MRRFPIVMEHPSICFARIPGGRVSTQIRSYSGCCCLKALINSGMHINWLPAKKITNCGSTISPYKPGTLSIPGMVKLTADSGDGFHGGSYLCSWALLFCCMMKTLSSATIDFFNADVFMNLRFYDGPTF